VEEKRRRKERNGNGKIKFNIVRSGAIILGLICRLAICFLTGPVLVNMRGRKLKKNKQYNTIIGTVLRVVK
jgi:hypothetical protein